jgi:hypothetical protein
MLKIRKWVAEEILWLSFKLTPKGTQEKEAISDFMVNYIKRFKV